MQPRMRIVALACVLTLLALPGLGLAQKKDKPGGGGGKKDDGGGVIEAKASLADWLGATPAKITSDGQGAYVSTKGKYKNTVEIDGRTGRFLISVTVGTERYVSLDFGNGQPLAETGGSCTDAVGDDVPDTPEPLPPSPIKADRFRLVTYDEFLLNKEDNTLTRDQTLNLLAMQPGKTAYAEVGMQFWKDGFPYYYDIRHQKRLRAEGSFGIVQVSAADTDSDGSADQWVIRPLPFLTPSFGAENEHEANLRRYQPAEPLNLWCDQGSFLLPFELTVTRLE